MTVSLRKPSKEDLRNQIKTAVGSSHWKPANGPDGGRGSTTRHALFVAMSRTPPDLLISYQLPLPQEAVQPLIDAVNKPGLTPMTAQSIWRMSKEKRKLIADEQVWRRS